jgi:hypothetical protein
MRNLLTSYPQAIGSVVPTPVHLALCLRRKHRISPKNLPQTQIMTYDSVLGAEHCLCVLLML